jgi:hypothetical protein
LETGCTSRMLTNWRRKLFFIPTLVVLCSAGFAQKSAPNAVPRAPKGPVIRATAPIEIIGTVVAHDENGGLVFGLVDVDAYLDCLVIRVEKILTGHISGKYVRADFLGGGDNNLPKTMFAGGPGLMKLEPATSDYFHTCDWTVPLNPPSGDSTRDFRWTWHLVPVGGATSFPDVNALSCYRLERYSFQEASPNPQR